MAVQLEETVEMRCSKEKLDKKKRPVSAESAAAVNHAFDNGGSDSKKVPLDA